MSTDTDDAIFKALADARRRKMLDLLKEGPKTTGQICQQFKELNRCTVMQHLGVLEAANLVIVRREGRCRWNYLNAMPIKDIHERWIGEYAVAAVGLLARLEESLRKPPKAWPE